MRVLTGRNVHGLWLQGVRTIAEIGERAQSRAGEVLVAPYPVMSVYEKPCERVLLDPYRDANPFFHLFEALWMLAGRDDAAFLNKFVKDFGERFAEYQPDNPDGAYIHGAYGFRWRRSMGFDQLDAVVEKLRKNLDDRQCVLQMWDAQRNPPDGYPNDLLGDWKDRPCNTHVYLRVRPGETFDHYSWHGTEKRRDVSVQVPQALDLTVCCRSNDIVWGAYGANAVHFSVLQEYLAGRIGVGVGRMYQLSNNWHAYVDVLEKYEMSRPSLHELESRGNPYTDGQVAAMPMAQNWVTWDDDLGKFMGWMDTSSGTHSYDNDWFRDVALKMALAHHHYRNGNMLAALTWAEAVEASDWRAAAVMWLKRRTK